MIWILLLIPLYGMADLWCGGGLNWKAENRGRPIYYAAPILLLAHGIIGGWQGAIVAGVWLLWRWPSWELKIGGLSLLPHARIAPRGWDQLIQTFTRHCLILPVAITHPLVVVWPFIATVLASDMARRPRLRPGDVELARGLIFGVLVAAWSL